MTVERKNAAGEIEEVEVEVSGTVHFDGGEARTWANPMGGCPPSVDVDIECVTFKGAPVELTAEDLDRACERLVEAAERD